MKTLKLLVLSIVAVCLLSSISFGQLTKKPSPSRSGREGMKATPNSAKRFLNVIKTKADFDAMARVYNAKTPYALPHAMFVIDRKNKKIFYVNSQMYRFHQDFANAQYLTLKRSAEFFKEVYTNDKRPLIVGTIAWQAPVQKYTFEFWEGDTIPGKLVKEAYDLINKTFFTEVFFKPNSIRHEDNTADLNLPKVTSDDISRNQAYLGMNTAVRAGRVHIIDKLDDTVEIGYNEIVILRELPLDLPPVSGIIVSQMSSPLSHVNLLAKGWNIPNAYIKNAHELFKEWDGRWIELSTSLTDYKVKACLKDCLDKKDALEKAQGRIFKSPVSNIAVTKLASLSEMRKKDSVIYGGKAANLGELMHGKLPGFECPMDSVYRSSTTSSLWRPTGLTRTSRPIRTQMNLFIIRQYEGEISRNFVRRSRRAR